MAKKQKVVPRNQLRFVIVTLFVFLLETISSIVFIFQNDFLRYASPGLLVVTIATLLLPALLFAIAYAFMQKSTVIRRATRAITWTFAAMLVNTLALFGWYATGTSYGLDLMQVLYGPALITLVLFILGLLIYRRNAKKTDKLLIPGWFEKVFVLSGILLFAGSIAIIIRDFSMYVTLAEPYFIYSVIPLALLVLLTVVGFFVLRPMKGKISRLYTSMFGVSFAFYIGTGLNQFANVLNPNGSTQNVLSFASYVVTMIAFAILLKRVHNRLKAKETL